MAGFRPELYSWLKQRGLDVRPSLAGTSWAKALPRSVRFRDGQIVKQLHGLAWKDGQERPRLSPGWYAAEAFEVALHVLGFLVLPLALVLYALSAQSLWSTTLAPRGVSGLLYAEAAQPLPLDGIGERYSLPLYEAFWIEAAVFVSLAGLRIILQYGRSFLPGTARPYRAFFAWILMAHLSLTLGVVGIMFTWCVLAALLEPSKYLPPVAGFVAVIAVLLTVGTEMASAAHRAKKMLMKVGRPTVTRLEPFSSA